MSLVLTGKSVVLTDVKNKAESQSTQHWLDKRIEGIKNVTTGGVLLSASLLLGLGLALFLPHGFEEVPWILIWIVFFGWLAVWGSIAIAKGLSSLIESRSRVRLMTSSSKEGTIDYTHQLPLSTAESLMVTRLDVSPQLSVTEGTTRELDDIDN